MGARRRWMIASGIALLGAGLLLLAWPGSADSAEACDSPEIAVYKKEGLLELYCNAKLRRSMAATFGANPVGPKEKEGDEKTPEGNYTISSKVMSDRFYRFLGVSYPNAEDKKRGREKGIQKLGGGIGIHGTTKKLAAAARIWTRFASATGLSSVWGPTDGCIGLTNEDVDFLYQVVPVGTKVLIWPARPEGSRKGG